MGVGTTTPSNYYADKLVVVDADEGGITIAGTGADQKQYLCFADGTSGAAAYTGHLAYDHDGNSMVLATDGGAAALTLNASQQATFHGQVTIDHNDGLRIKSHTGTYHKIYHNTSTNDLAF